MKRYMYEVDYTTDTERFYSLEDAEKFAYGKKFAIIYKLTFDGARVVSEEKVRVFKRGKII